MTKNILKSILFLSIFLMVSIPAFAQLKTDPILLDEPNDKIFDCKNDIFIEVSTQAAIGKQTASRTAEDQYLFMTVKILYLAEQPMAGLDKASFLAVHTAEDGSSKEYPLNFAVSMIANRTKGNINMAKTLKLPAYWTLDLVFNVDTTDKSNWTLVFSPMERGGNEPYCRIDVPLAVK